MPGKILAVKAVPGDEVKSGTVLVILEAMKMENDIMATADGTIKSVNVQVGDSVNTGDVLIVLG
jgi:glutaconyl-CoA decarboxylase